MAVTELKAKDRMARLIAKEPIDRVPVSLMGSLYTARLTGTPYREFWTNPDAAYRAQDWATELHGWDDTPSYGYGWSDWAGWDFGGEVTIPDSDVGFPAVRVRPVKTPEDAENLVVPDPTTAPMAGARLACARKNFEKKGKAEMHFSLTGMVGSIVGNDTLMRWYFRYPKAVHILFQKSLEYSFRTIDIYVKEFGGKNITVMETFPLDSQNLISPEVFSQFGFNYYLRLNQKLVDSGVERMHLHLCGNHTANLPFWKQLPIPPRTVVSVGSEMDIKKTADFMGPDVIISGNVSTTLLQYGTPEEVMEASRDIIEKVKFHPGGFVLRPACGMPPLTPPVNVAAMLKAARIYGRYD